MAQQTVDYHLGDNIAEIYMCHWWHHARTLQRYTCVIGGIMGGHLAKIATVLPKMSYLSWWHV